MGVLAILLHFHVTIAVGGLVSDPCASLRAQNVRLLDQLSARDAELSRLRSELAAVRSVKEGKERRSQIGTGAERALGNAAVPLSHRRRAETGEGCLSPPSHALPSLSVRARTHARTLQAATMGSVHYIAESAVFSSGLQATWIRSP